MLTVPEASARILEHIAVLGVERVPLLDSLGRVLAEHVRAPMTLPAWANSAMDGYAVRGADVETATAVGNAPTGLIATALTTKIALKWSPPTVGTVSQYQVWRASCPSGTTVAAPCALSQTNLPIQIGTIRPGDPVCEPGYNFCDSTTKKNVVYRYFVTATVAGKQSGASNIVTILGVAARENDR